MIVRWYVSKYSDAPERKEFHRETEHTLFYSRQGKERREAKVNSWGRYYDDFASAQSAIDARKAAIAEGRARRRVEGAAHELLEALIYARKELQAYEEALNGEDYNSLLINAAIEKATGEPQ